MKIKKTQRLPGTLCKERLVIKELKGTKGYDFLQGPENYNNQWTEYNGDLKAGTYAFAGGQWHNVKKLDASLLAHI